MPNCPNSPQNNDFTLLPISERDPQAEFGFILTRAWFKFFWSVFDADWACLRGVVQFLRLEIALRRGSECTPCAPVVNFQATPKSSKSIAFRDKPLSLVSRALSAFCADTSSTNQRHPDCSVPGCICPCHSRRSQATWKLEARGVMPSNNVEDFSPQVESVGLMEKLVRLGSNRHSTKVSSR